jgi:hypothetical protein
MVAIVVMAVVVVVVFMHYLLFKAGAHRMKTDSKVIKHDTHQMLIKVPSQVTKSGLLPSI